MTDGELLSRPIRSATKKRPARLWSGIVLQVAAMVAIGLLVYPDAANWLAALNHNAEIAGYVERVEQTPSPQRQQILGAAYDYNDQLQPGPLTDPYVSQAEDAVQQSALYLAYEEMLRVSGTDAIGTLSYPEVGVALPIYHGTSDEVISKGAGHMYGTSLPVGGPSTHAVLTAHSGLPSAKLFTPLHDAEVGDTFWISVLGEDHHYRVESVETVTPSDTESVKITEGEDWVTLFTCTPVGVNSHRLMVHAIRIASPDEDTSAILTGDGLTPGFPWWMVWFAGGSTLVGVLLFAPARKRSANAAAPSDGDS